MRFTVGFLVSVSLMATPAMAACWEADEYEAARIRDIQTMLMVSALKCGRAHPEMPVLYNQWVGRAKTQLLEGEKKLVSHFVREGDKLNYDKFTTALANKYSDLAEDERFCLRAKALLEADEKQHGILASVVAVLNARPNGVEVMCPRARPRSVIVVSPFDPLPVAGAAATAAEVAVTAPAAQTLSVPAGEAMAVAASEPAVSAPAPGSTVRADIVSPQP